MTGARYPLFLILRTISTPSTAFIEISVATRGKLCQSLFCRNSSPEPNRVASTPLRLSAAVKASANPASSSMMASSRDIDDVPAAINRFERAGPGQKFLSEICHVGVDGSGRDDGIGPDRAQ